MSWNNKAHMIVDVIFSSPDDYRPPPPNVRALPTRSEPMTEEYVKEVMQEASLRRDVPLFEQLDELLEKVKPDNPVKVAIIRRDIRWVRRRLKRQGHPWGK